MGIRRIWLPAVVERACLFLFSLVTVSLALYLLGSVQEFLDGTQMTLIRIMQTASYLFIFSGVYHIGLLVYMAFRRRRFPFVKLLFTLIGLILVAGIVVATNFLTSWAA